MADLLVRNLDQGILERLKKKAREHNRSLQGEIHSVLEQHARRMSLAETQRRAEALQKRFRGRDYGDSTDDIRADRDRA